MAESEEQLKSLSMRVKEDSEKAVLKFMLRKKNKKTLRTWYPVPSLHCKLKEKKWKQ